MDRHQQRNHDRTQKPVGSPKCLLTVPLLHWVAHVPILMANRAQAAQTTLPAQRQSSSNTLRTIRDVTAQRVVGNGTGHARPDHRGLKRCFCVESRQDSRAGNAVFVLKTAFQSRTASRNFSQLNAPKKPLRCDVSDRYPMPPPTPRPAHPQRSPFARTSRQNGRSLQGPSAAFHQPENPAVLRQW